jgi:2'-5' RNA ligase
MRLFIATTFPESVTREVHERVERVRSRLPHASWVRPETQHLTFAFLGEQNEALVETLAPALEARLRGVKTFSATVKGCGFFPNPRHARVGWLGLDPDQPFRDIACGVREVVVNAGIELDRADFKPHLTLMRVRDPWPPASIEMFSKAFRDYQSAPFVIDSVTLYSSLLNPKGAVHSAVRNFALI